MGPYREAMAQLAETTKLYQPQRFLTMMDASVGIAEAIRQAATVHMDLVQPIIRMTTVLDREALRVQRMALSFSLLDTSMRVDAVASSSFDQHRFPRVGPGPTIIYVERPYPVQDLAGVRARQGGSENVFALDGRIWKLRHAAMEKHAPDCLGMRYVALLLRQPGRPIAAVRLRANVYGGPDRSGDSLSDHSLITGEGSLVSMLDFSRENGLDLLLNSVMDARARRDFKRRLVTLRDERVMARDLQDTDWLARIEDEGLQIIRHVSTLTGIGGRSREFPGELERARKSVSKAINKALKLIQSVHPTLYHHLKVNLRLGSYPCYNPTIEILWHI